MGKFPLAGPGGSAGGSSNRASVSGAGNMSQENGQDGLATGGMSLATGSSTDEGHPGAGGLVGSDDPSLVFEGLYDLEYFLSISQHLVH